VLLPSSIKTHEFLIPIIMSSNEKLPHVVCTEYIGPTINPIFKFLKSLLQVEEEDFKKLEGLPRK